jgi:cob(I)alamin adenosyltransferase
LSSPTSGRSARSGWGGELGVDWLKGGDGFTWESPDLDKSEGRAAAAWRLAAAAIAGGDYQLVVVLDEITYPMNWGWIATEEVVAAVRARPAKVNVVATGRAAPAGTDRAGRHGDRDGQGEARL